MAYTMEEFAALDLSTETNEEDDKCQEERSWSYYDELSDVLEQHPPGMPGMRP